MDTPVTSLGSRSGVNWMRLKVQPLARARLLASIVLPTPGTSSISRCPWAASPITASSTSACLPTSTCSTVASSLRSSCVLWDRAPSALMPRGSACTSYPSRRGRGRCGPPWPRRAPAAVTPGRGRRRLLLDLQVVDGEDDLGADRVLQVVEHARRLDLVFDERVALAVS